MTLALLLWHIIIHFEFMVYNLLREWAEFIWPYMNFELTLMALKDRLYWSSLLTWANPFAYACCCFEVLFRIAAKPLISGRHYSSCMLFSGYCQPCFVLPSGEIMGFLDIWRERMAWSHLSWVTYLSRWRNWAEQIPSCNGKQWEEIQ